MESKPKTKQIFLSYSRNDKSLADALTKELEHQGYKVWDDKLMEPGMKWEKEIQKALEESDSMIALLNQHSYSSAYVRHELEHAFFDDRYKNRLLPVLIGSSSEDEFIRLPWVLTKLTFLELPEKLPMKEMVQKITEEFIALLEIQGEQMMIPKEVFLSHSSDNLESATQIANTLRKHGVPVWFSPTNINTADQWHDEIGKALRRCDWFMILLSNAATNSMWVKRELHYVLRHNQYDNHIMPVIIEDCDYEELSWTLEMFQMTDMTEDKENAFTQILRSWGLGFDRDKMG